MPAYDSRFNPPAPVAEMTVLHPVTGAQSDALRGKLDTGADITVIPDRLVAHLGLTPKGLLWTRGYDGSYSQRPVYYARMQVEGLIVAMVRCIAIVRNEALLGRNVLNHFSITLYGKQKTFAVTRQ
jgi:predicted aspartyl protease